MSCPAAEVIVVGGGPAGATTAGLLAGRGRDVLLLEKARFPREKPCAEYLSPGVADVLARTGALDRVLELQPARPRSMHILAGRSAFRLAYADEGGGRQALAVDRPRFDAALLAHAVERGARVRHEARVLGAIVRDGRVVGVRARIAGCEEALEARFVVAADGLHSAVARSLGLTLSAAWPRRMGLVARYGQAERIGPDAEMHVDRDAYCGLAPLGGGLVNVGLVVPLRSKPNGLTTEQYFERRLAGMPGVAAGLCGARRLTPVRGIGPLARRVRRVAGPGYLLVGDAAGFLDPFTGEGVFRALRGAEMAASSLEAALVRHHATTADYTPARRAAFLEKELACLLIQLFLRSHRIFGYVLRRLADRPWLADPLGGALGDYRPAAPLLRPGYLVSLLRP